jgi:hypothetical protein
MKTKHNPVAPILQPGRFLLSQISDDPLPDPGRDRKTWLQDVGLSGIVHAWPIQAVGARLSDVSVFFVSSSTGQPCSSHRLRIFFPIHHLESSWS